MSHLQKSVYKDSQIKHSGQKKALNLRIGWKKLFLKKTIFSETETTPVVIVKSDTAVSSEKNT